MTDCANNGSFISVRFVLAGCRQDIALHTCSILLNDVPLSYEAVFELKEAGFKLDVTRWVPRLTQSVYVEPNFCMFEIQLSIFLERVGHALLLLSLHFLSLRA